MKRIDKTTLVILAAVGELSRPAPGCLPPLTNVFADTGQSGRMHPLRVIGAVCTSSTPTELMACARAQRHKR